MIEVFEPVFVVSLVRNNVEVDIKGSKKKSFDNINLNIPNSFINQIKIDFRKEVLEENFELLKMKVD